MRISRINETEFMEQVVDFAHLHGWFVAHFRAARTADGEYETPCQFDAKGFPDLFMVRPGQCVAAELKVGKNTKSAEQENWLNALEASGIPAFTWYPDNWDEIEEVLTNGPEE